MGDEPNDRLPVRVGGECGHEISALVKLHVGKADALKLVFEVLGEDHLTRG